MDSLLVGTWDSDVKDASKIAGCRLQFFGSGELTCTVYVVGQPDYAIRLTYSVNGDVITTRLAFPPQEDQINYSIERDRILVVAKAGWCVAIVELRLKRDSHAATRLLLMSRMPQLMLR
jgi:hypothetical protein